MAAGTLSIKLRCASWQQLATIYKRDLSRQSMFLKASQQPPVGTLVRIDLELPSATVIELNGVIVQHVVDPQRGTGVELKLEPLPTKSVWLIESALAAEQRVRAGNAVPTAQGDQQKSGPVRTINEGGDIAAAEQELISALEAEAESLKKLNAFLVLGVGYEATDTDVRAAFGELTKRYHPDRFARYQSQRLRAIAAEIFILIRDAYRKLADTPGRAAVISQLGLKTPLKPPTAAKQTQSLRKLTPPRVAIAVPPIAAPKATTHDAPTNPGPHESPTNPSPKSAQLASTELARADDLAIPVAPLKDVRSGAVRAPLPDVKSGAPRIAGPTPTVPIPPKVDAFDTTYLEGLLDEGKLDEALAGYRTMAKKQPQERAFRAGIELVEGMRALGNRDRLEAAQRFEAVLEIDPSNERAARELAEMRRQATNERKGLLSRLMGKKEPT